MTEDNFDWLCDVCVCVSVQNHGAYRPGPHAVVTIHIHHNIGPHNRTSVCSAQMGRCQANEKPYYPH